MRTPSPPRSVDEAYSPISSPILSGVSAPHLHLPVQSSHSALAQDSVEDASAKNFQSNTRKSQELSPSNTLDAHIDHLSDSGSSNEVHSNLDITVSNGATIMEHAKGNEVEVTSKSQHHGSTEGNGPASSETLQDLLPKDWKDLEARYDEEMNAAVKHEQSIMEELDWVLQMMRESTAASGESEAERAKKRLRTRVAFVQQSEEALAEKQVHYKGVVDAFQNAVALLEGL